MFLDPEDEYSALIIPTVEEIQAALSDSNEFETTSVSDKDDDTTSRIELDNEGRIIRKHLSDKFMTKAFGNAYETKKYVLSIEDFKDNPFLWEDNKSKKVSGAYEWIKNLPYILLINSDVEINKAIIEELINCSDKYEFLTEVEKEFVKMKTLIEKQF